jgi:hypothetical protein
MGVFMTGDGRDTSFCLGAIGDFVRCGKTIVGTGGGEEVTCESAMY